MKLVADAVIAQEKLRDYLLTPRSIGDKSQFLALAGYNQDNWHRLEQDLRAQVLTCEAQLQESTPYGELYEIRGTLIGPNGTVLWVVTIWMIEHVTGQTKFITLFPDQGLRKGGQL
ncbi:MAG: hypothetical protein HYY20_06030 [Candidatus Tectomicrobia bacterium]|uniref:DUF6883 domain-containing protein n=1 Tax=Tectimicrobiota bacterium TaxID=2528274 RepID=A0A932CNN2_UNCTE|nr:hypothetical protein [Candidatus Tectomicrobia bacterium]